MSVRAYRINKHMKNKNKIYSVSWTEYHQTFVRAKNKTEALETAPYEANWLTDEGIVVDNLKAQELTKKESEPLAKELGL